MFSVVELYEVHSKCQSSLEKLDAVIEVVCVCGCILR